MGSIIDLGEMLEVEVGVDLGRADIGMAKQFLYRTQVATGFEQVTGKGVTQTVRVNACIQSLF